MSSSLKVLNKGNTIIFYGRLQSRGLVQRFIKGQSLRVHTCIARKGNFGCPSHCIIISQGKSRKKVFFKPLLMGSIQCWFSCIQTIGLDMLSIQHKLTNFNFAHFGNCCLVGWYFHFWAWQIKGMSHAHQIIDSHLETFFTKRTRWSVKHWFPLIIMLS